MLCSVITKNSNWEILTKNFATFKRWGEWWKTLVFLKFTEKVGGLQKTIYRGDCLKRGAWTVCRFKRGLGKKEGSGIFFGGLIPQSIL